jgi:hypothetical protein
MAVMDMGMRLMTGRLNVLLKVQVGGVRALKVRAKCLDEQSFICSMLIQASILTLLAITSTQIRIVQIVQSLIMGRLVPVQLKK